MFHWKQALVIGILAVMITGIVCIGAIAMAVIDADSRRDEYIIEETEIFDQEASAESEDAKESEVEIISEVVDTEKEESFQDASVLESQLIILQYPTIYTYDNMKKDLELLSKLYEEYVSVSSLGQTLDGREIYHLVIGNRSADHRILVNGSIHGREYMTSQLVMKQTVTFLQHLSVNDVYNGQKYTDLLDNIAIHVVPMINPDGVSISQYGMDGIVHDEVKQRVREIAALDGASAEGYYLTRWKSNANGVDLNRNFDALWESYEGPGHPSSDHYKGTSIGCEPESSALITLTGREMFDRTVSYHTQGNVIYWYFGQEGDLYRETMDFANCISALTGYSTDANYEYLDPAGYKDWGIHKLGIPGLTIEVGRETSPVPAEQFTEIWERNKYVWEETILNVKK